MRVLVTCLCLFLLLPSFSFGQLARLAKIDLQLVTAYEKYAAGCYAPVYPKTGCHYEKFEQLLLKLLKDSVTFENDLCHTSKYLNIIGSYDHQLRFYIHSEMSSMDSKSYDVYAQFLTAENKMKLQKLTEDQGWLKDVTDIYQSTLGNKKYYITLDHNTDAKGSIFTFSVYSIENDSLTLCRNCLLGKEHLKLFYYGPRSSFNQDDLIDYDFSFNSATHEIIFNEAEGDQYEQMERGTRFTGNKTRVKVVPSP